MRFFTVFSAKLHRIFHPSNPLLRKINPHPHSAGLASALFFARICSFLHFSVKKFGRTKYFYYLCSQIDNLAKNIGYGFPLILSAWNEKHWVKPELIEQPELLQVKLKLSIVNIQNSDEGGSEKIAENGGDIPLIELTERQRVILELISSDSTLSAKVLSEKMSEKMSEKNSVNERTIERDISKLKKLDYLRRIGGRKDGHWEVTLPLNSIVEVIDN